MAVPITTDNLTPQQISDVQKAQTTVNNSGMTPLTSTQGVGTPAVIPVDSLNKPVSTFNPPAFNPTDYSSYLQNNRVPVTPPANTPAPTANVDTSSLKDRIASQYFGLDLNPTAPTSLADSYAKLKNEAGLTEKSANIQKYSEELKRLEAEATAIPLQVQQNALGLGIDPGTAQKDTQSRLRQNTISRLLTTAKYNGALEDYNSAKENINTILDLTYKDQQAQNQYKKDLYDRAYAVATEDQKTQLDALKRETDAQKAKTDEFNTQKQSYVKSALDNNDFETAGKLATAKTPEELASYLGQTVPKQALPASAQEYQFAVKNGYTGTYTQYQNEDANRKAIIAKASVGSYGSGGLLDTVLQNPSLFNQLTPTVKASLAPELAKLGFDAFGKPLSDSAIKEINQTNTALTSLSELRNLIETNKDLVGPITGFAKLNPYSKARQIQSDIDRVRQQVGKALEGGVLRKEDEDKYKKILATITDTPETAIYKIDALISSINSTIADYKALQGSSGKNVSTISTAPEELRAKYNY